MDCVILAAGRGTRMGDLTKDCPKPMLPIKGKPKLAYTIEQLPDAITNVVIVVGYLKEQITEFFGDRYSGRTIQYVVQKDLSGTAMALHLAKDYLGEKFLVINGDDLYKKEDLEELLKHDWAVLAYETDDIENYGYMECDDEGNLIAIVEAPHDHKHGMANINAFVLKKDFFTFPLFSKGSDSAEMGLPQTLMQQIKKISLRVVRTKLWHPVGTPEDLQKAEDIIDQFTD